MQITRQLSTKHSGLNAVIETTLVFDFTEVEFEEVAQLATKSSSLIVDFQARARAAKELDKFKSFAGEQVISVRDLLDNRPQRRSKEEKLADELADADPDKLKAILAERGILVE